CELHLHLIPPLTLSMENRLARSADAGWTKGWRASGFSVSVGGSMPPSRRPKGRSRPPTFEPRVRRGTVRVPGDVATRLRAGHPLVFRDALGGRPMRAGAGEILDIVDEAGDFVAKGLFDTDGAVALRVISRDPNETIDALALSHRVEGAR